MRYGDHVVSSRSQLHVRYGDHVVSSRSQLHVRYGDHFVSSRSQLHVRYGDHFAFILGFYKFQLFFSVGQKFPNHMCDRFVTCSLYYFPKMLVFFSPRLNQRWPPLKVSFITVTYAKIIFQFLFFSKTTEPYLKENFGVLE